MKTFKIARIKKDLTQKQLSENLGMSIATINKIENGVKNINVMKVGDLKRLCDALDLDITEIIKATYIKN